MKFLNKNRIYGMLGLAAGLALVCLLVYQCTANQTPRVQVEALPAFEGTLSSRDATDTLIAVTNGREKPNRRFGFVDLEGNIVEPLDLIYFVAENNEIVAADETKTFRYLDAHGNTILSEVEGQPIAFADIFIDGYAMIRLKDEPGEYVIDRAGKICLEPTWKHYTYRNHGRGVFTRHTIGASVSEPVIVNIANEILYEGVQDLTRLSQPYGFYCDETDLWGIWDVASAQKVTEPRFTGFPAGFEDGIAIVENTDEALIVIDEQGNEILNLTALYPTMNDVYYQNNYFVLFFEDDRAPAMIDQTGKVIREYPYDSISRFAEDGLAVCQKDGTYGLVSVDGVEVLPPVYDVVQEPVKDGWRYVSKDGVVSRVRLPS